MGLTNKDYKFINNTHFTNNATIADKISSAIGFGTNLYGSFANNSDSVQDIKNQETQYTSNYNGFGYTKKSIDSNRLYEENERKNTTNALNTTVSGAQAGFTIGGPIGGIFGGAVGGALGLFGKHYGDLEQAWNINKASIQTANENVKSFNGARSQYMRVKNAQQYGDQQDQILSAKNGKLPGYHTGKPVYTSHGTTNKPADAMVSNGELIVAKDGSYNLIPGIPNKNDTERARVLKSDMVVPVELASYYMTTGDYAGTASAIAGMQNYKKGKMPGFAEGWVGNAIPAVLGGLAGFGQYANAIKERAYKPNTYVGNPYEGSALTTLAGLRVNPYPIIQELRSAETRTKYGIDSAGGLSGGQRAAARLAALNTTQSNIAKLLGDIQKQNNAYKANYAQAAINAGQASRQARMQANQWDLDMYAKAHAARNRGIQTGIANMLSQIQQYQANEFKRRQFNDTMSLYRDDMDLRKKNMNYIQNLGTRGIGYYPMYYDPTSQRTPITPAEYEKWYKSQGLG